MPDYQAQTLMAAPIVSRLQILLLDEITVGYDEGRAEEIPVDETIEGETVVGETPVKTLIAEEVPAHDSLECPLPWTL